METIQACVNQRLLTKADRLFTGTAEGRIIELLQNARRADATKVVITNEEGWVTVKDNGQGIDDFAKLLDLGGSGWDETCEESEDPAGVGIFCLAPREVTIRSKGKMVTISKDGWTHEPVEVLVDPKPVKKGTILRFHDEEWNLEQVEHDAAFCGMQVIVDGKKCPKPPFVSESAAHHPELGCRIEVRTSSELSEWHRSHRTITFMSHNCLVNFHGQIVGLDYHPVSEHALYYLIDLTGEPTGIRLMLPARTQLVENEAFAKLKVAIELEAYRYIERRRHHELPYKEFLRAKDLGINLPEAKPTFTVGLISSSDAPEPVEIVMPKDFPLSKCYRFDPHAPGDDCDETNAHLLAALGTFTEPFIPVNIHSCYDGYSWAKLPAIGTVEVKVGKELHSEWLWSGKLTCVDALQITACTSDGKVFASPVCMAKAPRPLKEAPGWADEHVLITPDAQDRLQTSEIWYHLGGWCDEGDTYETQLCAFEEDLNRFWANLIGPDEQLRQSILAPLNRIEPDWRSITVFASGTVAIRHVDGAYKTIEPPKSADAEPSPLPPIA
jgi:hypothetical protein